MTNAPVPRDLSGAVGIERKIAVTLQQAAHEISCAEFFDIEQRAEVYSIMQALQADSQAHQALVGRWVSDRTGEAHDA